jgi:hypothetical protein
LGSFARWYDGTIGCSEGKTRVSIEVGRNRIWVLPGLIFVAAGALGAVTLIWSLLRGGAGDPSPIQWFLALGALPFGLLWLSWGTWLASQLASDKALRWIEVALELELVDG